LHQRIPVLPQPHFFSVAIFHYIHTIMNCEGTKIRCLNALKDNISIHNLTSGKIKSSIKIAAVVLVPYHDDYDPRDRPT
jgi:hypothetical protein